MKIKRIGYTGIFFLLAFVVISLGKNVERKKISKNTGIFLDTLGNEVILAFTDNQPAYYYSNITTPICETGECKPIRINIFWDLLGRYIRYDLPYGKELTKKDHQPFTEKDYDLLDEIIRGEDPRYSSQEKNTSTSEKKDKKDGKISPSVSVKSRVLVDKHKMVDAISGATLPLHKDKFVPGALYTTYTVWDLANTHRNMMMDHTRSKLFVPKYYDYFFSQDDFKLRDELVKTMALQSVEENAYPRLLARIIDTSKEDGFIAYCIDRIAFDKVSDAEVVKSFEKIFFDDYPLRIKRKILEKWSRINIPSQLTGRLPSALEKFPELFDDILKVINWQEFWPDGVVEDLVNQIHKEGDKTRRQKIFDLFEKRRAESDRDDWKKVKKVRREYDLEG